MKEKYDDFEAIFKYDTVKVVYDNTEVIGIPTNNWKKMHGFVMTRRKGKQ